MPEPLPPSPFCRRSSAISTTTSRIQFQSYYCRGTTNTTSAKCMKGWITGPEAIAWHICAWHQFTNFHTMETMYECPCSCPGAAFSAISDMLLHVARQHPQRLSQLEKNEQSPAPDGLEGDTEHADLAEEEEGVTMLRSRHSQGYGMPRPV